MQKNNFFALFIIFFVLLFSLCSGLSTSIQKNFFEKGESLKITGNASPGKVSLKIFSQNWLVEKKETNTDNNGFFSFEYNILFTYPSGAWKAIVSQKEDINIVYFDVKNSSESAFLLVTMLSPSKKEFVSTEKISFGAKVTDAGRPLERAVVSAWVTGMEKIVLEETEEGIYSTEAVLPLATQPGDYNVFITAEKVFSKEKIYGGEIFFKINVSRPEIILDILRPSLQEILAEKPLEIVVLPKYSTGAKIENYDVVADIQNEKVVFEKSQEGFTAKYILKEQAEELLKINVFAFDSFGNSGQKEITLKIIGTQERFLEKNFYWIALAIISVAAASTVSFYYLKKRKSKKGVDGKIKEIEIQMKQLENDFYKNSSIDRKTFKEEMEKSREEMEKLKRKY